jgi:ATP-binding cassette subfamily B multidrug efflux pump
MDPLDEVQGDRKAMASLIRFARPDRYKIAFALSLLLGASVCVVGSARLLGSLVTDLTEGKRGQAIQWAVGVLILESLAVLASYWGSRFLAKSANRSILRIRQRLFQHLGQLPMSYFDKTPLGKTVTRLTYDVEGLEDFFSGTLTRLVRAVFSLVVVLAAMLLTNLQLGIWVLIATLPAVAVTMMSRNSIRHWNREVAVRNSQINTRLSELLNGLNVIRAFGAENWSKRDFDVAVDSHLDSQIRLNVINAWSRSLILFLCYLPLLVVLFWGGQSVIAGALSLGLFVSFIRYCERFSQPISQLAQEIHLIQTAVVNAERIHRFLQNPPEDQVLVPKLPKIELERLRGEVEFRNLFMAYDETNWVLKDLSFRALAGTRVGLAGRTGSGKSTLLSLLARLYEFQRGELLIDGRDIRRLDPAFLRSSIGQVSQDVNLFRGTIEDNLCLGRRVSSRQLQDAVERSQLHHVFRRRNLKLDTWIQAQGLDLSQGERQLINLARVLIQNPAIVVLDEATANIDPELEANLLTGIEQTLSGRSCFIVAHRLSTLSSCDVLLVFKDGQLVESGRHDALEQKGGYYSELLRSSAEWLDAR